MVSNINQKEGEKEEIVSFQEKRAYKDAVYVGERLTEKYGSSEYCALFCLEPL